MKEKISEFIQAIKMLTIMEILTLIGIGLCIILPVASWPIYSHFEAKAYNNVTGKKVSTIDAMFLELRVTNE